MTWPCFDHRCLWSCYLYTSCCWHACDLGDKESYLGSDAGLQGLDSVGRRQWNCCQPSHHRHRSVRQGYRSKRMIFFFSHVCKQLVLKSAVTYNKWQWNNAFDILGNFPRLAPECFLSVIFSPKVYYYTGNMKRNFLGELLYIILRFCDLYWWF